MPLPTASVVIPSYNHAAFIDQALASVLTPAHFPLAPLRGDPELEVVLVDDGSSDDTLERLERWRQDPRLRVIEQENRGAHAALNRGIAASRGEVIFILNSDDAFHPRRIGCFLEHFARDPELTMLGSWIEVVGEDGGRLGIKEAFRNMPPWSPRGGGARLSDTGDPVLALLAANYLATTSNVAFRRRIGGAFLPLRYAHDWDFFLTACRQGAYRLIEEPLVRYRVHPDNTIAEGREAELGRGQMRFEILWVMARHAGPILERAVVGGGGTHAGRPGDTEVRADLDARLWRSLPPFASDSTFQQLLFLRGSDRQPAAAYDRLLDSDHPYRTAAIRALAARPDD